MIDLNKFNKKVEIEYPCDWNYKIIGENTGKLHQAVKDSIKGKKFEVNFSNTSSKGKYFSLNVKIRVENEKQRNNIYQNLKKHRDVKMVM
ncbi:MAG: DUF493 domain-containing protein [Calditrichaeota bacterium]|nr:MAG: DUF493 domain-containing protein [Calditrichota bacterium]